MQSLFQISRHCRRVDTVGKHLVMAANNVVTNSKTEPTVGMIIIGDEILKGQVKDSNSHYLCKRLYRLGVRVKKISVVTDDLDEIANEVKEFSAKYTHVITSGGIGPTHDDLTFEGVARAFEEPTYHHPELVKLCGKFFGTTDVTSPKLKLALVPKSAKTNYGINKQTGEQLIYPLVSVRNVYVFPGVPPLLERAFDSLDELFLNPGTIFHTKVVYIAKDEVSITPILNQVNERFKKDVILGSYPDFYNSYYKVKLTLESQNMEKLSEARQYIEDHIGKEQLVDYDPHPLEDASERIYRIIEGSGTDPLDTKIKSAITTIEECIEKYKLSEVCVGFNGGKDCTVLLHLCYAVIKKKYPEFNDKIQSLYIRRGLPFPELEQFIEKGVKTYNLDSISLLGRIRDSLGELKTSHPHIKAVLMGTRATDPYSEHLKSFSMTDADWPQFMRVSPILDWSYSDVWTFLRRFSLPYCILYDRGYTSLGSMENTHPNPKLAWRDEKGITHYKPAYLLEDWHTERDGRN